MEEYKIPTKEEMLLGISFNVKNRPELALEIMSETLNALYEYKKETDKRNANIWLVVQNLKPEHLKEMKELIIPEVFENLGIK